MLLAAVFEVGGDALIRRGVDGRALTWIFMGFVVLGSYGVVVNLVGLDFSRMLGAYVGWFAVVGVAFGRFVFGNPVAPSTWFGLLLIAAGSGVIQFGAQP
jgi:small multidrug resistance family-3 protein